MVLSCDLDLELIPESFREARGVGIIPRPLWPLFIAEFALTHRRATIVVPDEETLVELKRTLTLLFPEGEIAALPGWDIHPYDSLSPHPRIVASLLAEAHKVLSRSYDLLLVEATVYLCPLPLVPGTTPLLLTPGTTLSEEELKERGYRRVPEVQDPGEFSSRGSVLDLWSPLEEYPLRVDREDTHIEVMRLFDPVSQLSLERVRTYALGWVKFKLPKLGELKTRIQELLRSFGEAHTTERAEGIAERLLKGEEFPGHLSWLLSIWTPLKLPYPPDLLLAPERIAERLQGFQRSTLLHLKKLREAHLPYPELPSPPPLTTAPEIFSLHDPKKPSYTVSPLPPLRLSDPHQTLMHFLREAKELGYRVILAAKRDHPLLKPSSTTYPPRRASEVSTPEEVEEVGESEEGGIFHKTRVSNEKIPSLHLEPFLIPPVVKGHWDLHPARVRILDGQLFFRPMVQPGAYRTYRSFDLKLLKEGDLIVHRHYGIGRYLGTKRLNVDGEEVDMVELIYAEGDRLFVPVTRIYLLDPYYAGIDAGEVKLDRLHGKEWKQRQARARADFVRYAGELLKLYAHRAEANRPPLNPPGELSLEVERNFPYEETPDQLKILAEIEEDLRSEHPMDRLVVGDVGFGKTEIALRTAMRFIENGYQVAFLAPTTILAAQHALTCEERLRNLPVRLASLTRFVTGSLERQIILDLKRGLIDLLIGTHRILMPNVEFQRLGLVIVDEEHRFGVKHKEALKSLRKNVDFLSLSATPIPRTLQIHLSGIRSISTLYTPPPRRLEVETRVVTLSPSLVVEAIQRERQRRGQIFILYNRIEELPQKLQWIQGLVPDLRIAVIHGKMPSAEIRQVFKEFRSGCLEALLATTIIESGLDFPRANTLIVLDAHRYGLAELYQLRGRVGRSHIRAFCYLCVPPEEPLSDAARRRLKALEEFAHLGSSFQLALMDLEIRGAGELLGKRQSGHIRSLGFATTLRLLEEAIQRVRSGIELELMETELLGDYPPSLSSQWIPDPHERLYVYHQLLGATTPKEAQRRVLEICDHYGRPPTPRDEEFLELMVLRPYFPLIRARAVRFSLQRMRLWMSDTTPLDRLRLISWVKSDPQRRTLTPEYLEITTENPKRMQGFCAALEDLLAVAIPTSSTVMVGTG